MAQLESVPLLTARDLTRWSEPSAAGMGKPGDLFSWLFFVGEYVGVDANEAIYNQLLARAIAHRSIARMNMDESISLAKLARWWNQAVRDAGYTEVSVQEYPV